MQFKSITELQNCELWHFSKCSSIFLKSNFLPFRLIAQKNLEFWVSVVSLFASLLVCLCPETTQWLFYNLLNFSNAQSNQQAWTPSLFMYHHTNLMEHMSSGCASSSSCRHATNFLSGVFLRLVGLEHSHSFFHLHAKHQTWIMTQCSVWLAHISLWHNGKTLQWGKYLWTQRFVRLQHM